MYNYQNSNGNGNRQAPRNGRLPQQPQPPQTQAPKAIYTFGDLPQQSATDYVEQRNPNYQPQTDLQNLQNMQSLQSLQSEQSLQNFGLTWEQQNQAQAETVAEVQAQSFLKLVTQFMLHPHAPIDHREALAWAVRRSQVLQTYQEEYIKGLTANVLHQLQGVPVNQGQI